ncbi:S-ribosylhomocysteine lyase [Salinispira pacifica]|uniref:S-ribosylhomocysteine lyase n=1 Tax=Salinispira pacifica TaxID=1307761 RepID=V5WDC5_9SPIO|nr:S-ribosylhomocysteine lyase [Salinispira pacifica]AHC13828.1 S-ribosylhomocysteine lyase/ Autoinducer-2 production protein LuxS [Salinispira pacifica]
MDKIPSFTIDHNKLLRGIYVSRIDEVGNDYVTTYDIRMKEPNREPVVDVPALHTIEHLGATFLRNDTEWKDEVVYFGPMGCRTGFYLLMKGKRESAELVDLITNLFRFMSEFDDDIPGAAAKDCGNYLSHNLTMTRWESRKFLHEVLENIGEQNLRYPD